MFWRRKAQSQIEHPIPCKPGIEFRAPINGEWGKIDDFLLKPELLVQHYLGVGDDAEDEILGGGFFIYADGKLWNSEEHVESMYNSLWWIEGLAVAHSSDEREFIWAWEETNLQIWIKDSLIFMEDSTHHENARLPQVCFKLREFITQFRPQAEKFALLVDKLRPLITSLPDPEPESASYQRILDLKECFLDLNLNEAIQRLNDAIHAA